MGRTRAPRRRKRIPKTLPSIFPASVKKSIGARWNNERVAKPFLCVEKEYQEQIKEKYIKEKYISRTESISKNKNKKKKKESNIETLAISCWIAVGDSL